MRPLSLAFLLLAVAAAPAYPAEKPAEKKPVPKKITGKSLYSHGNEELIIRDFFQDREGGVFLDVGCAWPIEKNNTYYLEKHLGWSGIGVDGLPDFAPGWKAKRPKSQFFNYLVSDHSDTVEPFYRSELKGTSAATKDGDEMKGPAGRPVKHDEIKVPTTTLNKLLDDHGVKKVDLLSMDIEGYEPIALAGFDIERFKPELVCIETKPKNRDVLLEYFAKHGYVRLDQYLGADTTNWYFAPKPR